ncbi:MAG: prepilin-type N-terminal cleavage/methylation domain-containing protein [Terriglobales bacterium]
MSDRPTKRESGFSLLEMVVSMALGTIVLGAAVQIYSQGVASTWTVTQRAEMQQDFRAASNILTRDLSMAGAGLGNDVAIALPSTSTPQYGCDQTLKCYINGGAGTYPKQGATPYLYGLLPGYDKGPTLNVSQGATDVVTVVYTDSAFYLNCYTATLKSTGVVTFAPAASPTPWPTPGCLPTGVASPQAVNDTVAGLTPGDLVMMNLNGTEVVGEVTGPVTLTSANTYTVPFANGDVLKMNQTVSPYYLNGVAANATGTSPVRILVITYYIDNTVNPPRLMRQISGHSPVPVAENIVYLKFSYDLYNDATSTPAINQPNPGSGDANDTASNGLLPDQITKINILNMAIDSTLMGSQFGQGNGYQRLDLQTSVSARNLTYSNEYPN